MIRLDWSGHNGAPLAQIGRRPGLCRHCRAPALLREPGTDRPCHKVCAEAELNRRAVVLATTPAGVTDTLTIPDRDTEAA